MANQRLDGREFSAEGISLDPENIRRICSVGGVKGYQSIGGTEGS